MNAVDTNVLLYVHDPRDPAKQAKVTALVASLNNGALLWQVACEYVSAGRKLAPLGFRQEDAWRELNRLQSIWTGVLPSWSHLHRAERSSWLHAAFRFGTRSSFAVALEAGISTLYSEDLAGVGLFPGLNIINPFVP